MLNKNHTILTIEDELLIWRFLKTSVVAQYYEFLEAMSVQECFAIINDCKPDVILLDLRQPDMDGISVIKNLRSRTSIPLIILSARVSNKVAALDAGADDHLSKPFSVVELHSRIRVALRHAQRNSENTSPGKSKTRKFSLLLFNANK